MQSVCTLDYANLQIKPKPDELRSAQRGTPTEPEEVVPVTDAPKEAGFASRCGERRHNRLGLHGPNKTLHKQRSGCTQLDLTRVAVSIVAWYSMNLTTSVFPIVLGQVD